MKLAFQTSGFPIWILDKSSLAAFGIRVVVGLACLGTATRPFDLQGTIVVVFLPLLAAIGLN